MENFMCSYLSPFLDFNSFFYEIKILIKMNFTKIFKLLIIILKQFIEETDFFIIDWFLNSYFTIKFSNLNLENIERLFSNYTFKLNS